MLTGKLVVLGGTGSFGHKVATTLARTENLDEVTIFSRDEKKQHDMKRRFPDFRYIIGDIRDYDAVKRALFGATTVFQAAALKQVPACEEHPEEALKTNCLGVMNVCRAAWDNCVETVIQLSTDKAVEPINAMGISKAMAERIVTSQPTGGPTFCCVRYGNVLGTRGSIFPVWAEQFRLKQPLTLTDPSMTRFVMNLRDSVELVRYAATEPEAHGQIYVWNAPALTVAELANGFRDHVLALPDYLLQLTNRRPGEKQHEILVCQDEVHRTLDAGHFVTVQLTPNGKSLRGPLRSDTAQKPHDFAAMCREAVLDMESAL